MVLVAHVAVEILPETRILTQSAVAAARHITEDPVKLKVLFVASLLHVGEFSGVIVSHHHCW